MLQHKQEERELKRQEGDIIKKQHQLRRVMDDVNNSECKKNFSPSKVKLKNKCTMYKIHFAELFEKQLKHVKVLLN